MKDTEMYTNDLIHSCHKSAKKIEIGLFRISNMLPSKEKIEAFKKIYEEVVELQEEMKKAL